MREFLDWLRGRDIDFCDEKGNPKRCPACGCSLLREEIEETVTGHVAETRVICRHCGFVVCEWLWGCYDVYVDAIRRKRYEAAYKKQKEEL